MKKFIPQSKGHREIMQALRVCVREDEDDVHKRKVVSKEELKVKK